MELIDKDGKRTHASLVLDWPGTPLLRSVVFKKEDVAQMINTLEAQPHILHSRLYKLLDRFDQE